MLGYSLTAKCSQYVSDVWKVVSPFMCLQSSKAYHQEALTGSRLKTVEKNWDDIIFACSNLNFTMEKDKLPAVSGQL